MYLDFLICIINIFWSRFMMWNDIKFDWQILLKKGKITIIYKLNEFWMNFTSNGKFSQNFCKERIDWRMTHPTGRMKWWQMNSIKVVKRTYQTRCHKVMEILTFLGTFLFFWGPNVSIWAWIAKIIIFFFFFWPEVRKEKLRLGFVVTAIQVSAKVHLKLWVNLFFMQSSEMRFSIFRMPNIKLWDLTLKTRLEKTQQIKSFQIPMCKLTMISLIDE